MNSEIFQQVFGLQREELNKQFARLELLANLHERLTGQNPLKPKDAKRKCEEETSQRKRRATNGKVLKKRISLRPTEIEVELIPLLSPPHGCLEEKSVPVFVDVMKKTSLTDDKCVVLTCIKSTKSQVVLAKFVDCDGLCVLNDWLLEWRKNLQIDMLRHMLESVAHLPVTVASLKSSNFGKSLKKLTKLQDLSKMAENLIEEYTSRITGSTQEASNSKSFIENFFLNLPDRKSVV